MQTLPRACPAVAWARGRDDGQGKMEGLPGAWRDRVPREEARAALGGDVHQGGAWRQGIGSLQDGR